MPTARRAKFRVFCHFVPKSGIRFAAPSGRSAIYYDAQFASLSYALLASARTPLRSPLRFNGVGDHDITEFDITESDVTFFQEFDITESDITEKGNFYNGIRYNGICYNMKLEIGITKFVTVESDITGKWKLI